jgi:RNA polymerase sigma-32 factor
MRLVIAIAARFRNFRPADGRPHPGRPCRPAGSGGAFEPDREVRFSTYATWWIRASIQDYILRNWSIVRGGTSSSQKSLFFNLRRLRARLAQSTDQRPRRAVFAEIAEALGVSVGDVEVMDSRLSAPDTSLNAPLHEADDRATPPIARTSWSTMRRCPTRRSATRSTANAGDLAALGAERAQRARTEIVKERRLRDDGRDAGALGESLGISKERVRQIENRALEKLREALLRENPDSAAFV